MNAQMPYTSSLRAHPVSSRATGSAADYIAVQYLENRARLQKSVYFGPGDVFNELCAVYDQCHEKNWDGYGAVPIELESYRHAYRFLESLPLGIPDPSVGAEPDGHLTLEWHRATRCTLSVSVSPDGDLHYAALLGVSKQYGSEPFFGEAPAAILNLLQRVLTS